MEQYTIQQRIYIVQTYYENGRTLKDTFRKIRDYFGVSNRPHENIIHNLIQKFESSGSVDNVKLPRREKTVENRGRFETPK